MNTCRRQCGISMVEIMVALVLSLVLSAGVLQIYLSSKQSYRAQEGFSRLQENARFANDAVARYLRFTAYKFGPADTNATAFTTVSGGMAAGQTITGTEGANAGDPDTVTFRYKDDGLLGDCGTPPPADGVQHERVITFSIDNSKELTCNVAVDGVVTVNNQPIVEGVENMQILYGVDTDNDSYANQYVTATNVPGTGGSWPSVVSVRIALLLSTLQNVSTEADSASYNLLGTAIPAANDRWRRHLFLTTIGLRNKLP